MEVLSHINKRVKNSATIRLPLLPLLQLATQQPPAAAAAGGGSAPAPSSSPLVRSFALVYADMAAERATAEEQLAAVSGV